MYNELNTVLSLSSLVMVVLYGGHGDTEAAQPGRRGQSTRMIKDPVKYFNPHSNSIASGLCSYKFITSKVFNRIPEEINSDRFNWILSTFILLDGVPSDRCPSPDDPRLGGRISGLIEISRSFCFQSAKHWQMIRLLHTGLWWMTRALLWLSSLWFVPAPLSW